MKKYVRYYGILGSRRKKAALKRCGEILEKRKHKKNTEPIKSFTWKCPKCKIGVMHVYQLHINRAPG